MSSHLITFLGGSSQMDLTKRYRKTVYRIGDALSEPAEYFGSALQQAIQADRFVILGTAGSMWDVLLETWGLSQVHPDLHSNLYDAVCENRINDDLLSQLTDALRAHSNSIELRIIPYGYNKEEQVKILEVMSESIESGDEVHIDITHGLRHLPAIAQISAMYIAKVYNAKIEKIYYGAYELTEDNITPVIDLVGLLEIADWLDAITAFSKDGDYSVFSNMVASDNPQAAEELASAAFNERNLRHKKARKFLGKVPSRFDSAPLSGVGALFENSIRRRINWQDGLGAYQQQRQLAYTYLSTKDYMRCGLYTFEAFITLLQSKQKGRSREACKTFFESDQSPNTNPDWPSYKTLRDIRNAMAHGDERIDAKTEAIFSDEKNLAAVLENLMSKLLPE